MSSEKPIIFAGGIFRDLVAYCERFPKVGETILGSKFKMGFGGKSANQAVMCSRLGGKSVMLGMVGTDDNGKAYVENFKDSGVDARFLGISDTESTGVASIIVETSTGNNQIVIVPGANSCVSQEQVDSSESAFKTVAAVVVGLEVSHDAMIRVLELARKHGVKTITNAAPARPDLDPRIFEFTDILCVNETEAEIITGRTSAIETEKDIEESSKILLQKCQTVILTMGSRGSVLVTRDNPTPILIPADRVEKVVDTTGAGDAFVGALAYFLVEHSHLDLVEIIRRSGSIATKSVQNEGTQTSFPFKKDLDEKYFN